MENLMISSVELAKLLEVPQRQATRVIREVNEELRAKGVYVFNTKPPKAPAQKVFEKIGIEVTEWKTKSSSGSEK